MKEIIHFVHGNGFPSPCYRQLLSGLEGQYDCYYLDRVGHNPDFPVSENWDHLVGEVISSIQTQSVTPVIAVGHSLGGVLSLIASIKQPSLFKAVILLDSPLLGRMKSILIRLSKVLGVIDHVTPAARTRKRRQHFKSREQAQTYLRRRQLFKSFSDNCLQDYIDYGMTKTDEGYSLRFDPQIEYQIYRTIPHTCNELEGKLHVPTVLIYGDDSYIINSGELRYMKKKYGISCVETRGTHMFPMEHPDEVARLIIKAIEGLNLYRI